MLQGSPARWTGMIARVRGESRFSICSGSMLPSLPISARIGDAPTCKMLCTVAQKVIGVVITSSPGPTPRAQRQMESGGGRVYGSGVRRIDIFGEIALEAGRAGAGCEPPRPQCVDHLLDFLFTDRGAMKADEAVRHLSLQCRSFFSSDPGRTLSETGCSERSRESA